MENDIDLIRKALAGDDDAAADLGTDIEDICDNLCDEVIELRKILAKAIVAGKITLVIKELYVSVRPVVRKNGGDQ